MQSAAVVRRAPTVIVAFRKSEGFRKDRPGEPRLESACPASFRQGGPSAHRAPLPVPAKGGTMLKRVLSVLLLVMLAGGSRPMIQAHGDGPGVVLEWNAVAVSVTTGNPFTQARFMAITQLAVFEAVNAVTGNYEPYLGTILEAPGASAEAAAIAAAYRVLKTYFPANTTLDPARANSLAAIPDGAAKSRGIATGEAAAAAMIANRIGDNSAPPPAGLYTPGPPEPGKWQLTPSCTAGGGVFLDWRTVTPFGVRSVDRFISDPPPAITSRKYAKDYLEVKTVGAIDSTARPQDRTDVACSMPRPRPLSSSTQPHNRCPWRNVVRSLTRRAPLPWSTWRSTTV